jgi:hypothetical protein
LQALHAANGIDTSAAATSGPPPTAVAGAFLSDAELASLANVAGSASVLTCSVLGSYLSQEVVKAVSLTGQPALNVFVFTPEDLEAKALPIR